jgi:hypothetical protein
MISLPSMREKHRIVDITSWDKNRVYPSNALSGLGMLHAYLEARKVVLEQFRLLSSRSAREGALI